MIYLQLKPRSVEIGRSSFFSSRLTYVMLLIIALAVDARFLNASLLLLKGLIDTEIKYIYSVIK